MASGRVHASEVYDWLGLEPVRHTFGLSEDDRDQIREWLDRSGIRWGLDADHRAEQDQPADPQNTWSFGLERLCLGAVMADDGRGILPWVSLPLMWSSGRQRWQPT